MSQVPGRLVEAADGGLRLDRPAVLAEAVGVLLAPVRDLAPPGLDLVAARPRSSAAARRRPGPPGSARRRRRSATSTPTFLLIEDGSMSTWIFLLRGREAVEPAGDAVVEAGADADHHVAVVHGQVGLVGAVHAEHADELRVRGREGAEAHQRQRDRVAGGADQLGELRAGRRAGVDDAAADIEDRPLGAGQQLGRLLDPRGVGLACAGGRCGAGPRPCAQVGRLGHLDVLGQVDHDRPGPAGARDVERLVHHAGEVARPPSPGSCAWCRAG